MFGLIIWLIVFAGAAGMVAKGIIDADGYISYEDFEHKDYDHIDEEEEEQITIMHHYPDGTVEIQQ
ncbi:MAG: hypothetical protein RMI79_03735 [Nitrososphaerota archaeon]|nr:hypothetical protein [Nitrososphaerota archaeon]